MSIHPISNFPLTIADQEEVIRMFLVLKQGGELCEGARMTDPCPRLQSADEKRGQDGLE